MSYELCVAYETLARRGELVALQIRDLDFHPDGTGQAIVRCGKTDAAGQGRVAYLARDGQVGQDLAGACRVIRGSGVSAVGWAETDRRAFHVRKS